MPCSPMQRKIDLTVYEADLRRLWLGLGMSQDTVERAIEVTRKEVRKSAAPRPRRRTLRGTNRHQVR